MPRILPFALALLLAAPAAAQGVGDMMSADALTSAAADAVKTLSEAGKDKLLVADLIGADITGPDGKTIGTIDNLVVVPGGTVVAAVVTVDDQKLAVPYRAVKVARTGGKVQAQLGMTPSDLKDSQAVDQLTKALPGG